MIFNIKHITNILCVCLLSACHNIDREVDKVLDNTPKEQQKELLTFIEHFSNVERRLNAAKFIVANLLNKYSTSEENGIFYQSRIDSIDSSTQTINNPKGYIYNNDVPVCPKQYTQENRDINRIQADSLIGQLDAAFNIWEQSPWSSQYPEYYFTKYIAPYRIANEPLEYYWRTDAYTRFKHLLQEYNDSSIVDICLHIYQNITYQTNNLFWGEPLQSYTTNIHYKRGTCSDYAVYTAMIMRALGIPVSVDFIPFWGDNNNGHSFNALLLPDGSCKGFNNKDDLTTQLNLSGKVPKVYRKEYEIQRNTVLYKYKDTEYLPPLFAEHDIADVTELYDIPKTNIVIQPDLFTPTSHLVFLSVYAPQNWQPVAWTEFVNGKAKFQNIGIGYTSNDSPGIKGENYGEGCLFMPISYVNEKAHSLTYPLILKENESVHYLNPKTKETESVILYRKYPRKSRIINFARKMKDGYFELSNDPNFVSSDIVYFIDSLPQSHTQTVSLPQDKKYRFMRFYKRKGGISIGEIGCLDSNNQIIQGKPITDKLLLGDSDLKNINDGSVLSYFDISGLDDLWVGLDYGKPTLLSKLFFCPRTDDNDVSPGDEYELFYWNNQWTSLGKQSAQKHQLIYNNVPRNALLLLRDLTKGREERPFTYEKGKQIWW